MNGTLLFGGSFDPIHIGHMTVCRYVADRLAVSRIVLIPAASPPHKPGKQLAPAEHRLAMCRLAAADDARVEVDDWETRQSGPNYTLLTVQHFRAARPSEPLYWLIGMDSLADLSTWYRVAELAAICTIVTARRPGIDRVDLSGLARLLSADQMSVIQAHIVETPLVDISATDIRARIRRGEDVSALVGERVASYIRTHRVYAASAG